MAGPIYRAADGFVESMGKVVDRTQSAVRKDLRYVGVDLWEPISMGDPDARLRERLEETSRTLEELRNSKAYRVGRRLGDLAHRFSFR